MNYDSRIDNLKKKYSYTKLINSYDDNNQKDKIINILSKENNIDNRIKKITDLVYNQEWSKLHIINKKIKIEEYIDEISNLNNLDLDSIKNNLIQMLNDKKLKNKDVKYDIINGKILDILCLKKIDDTYHIEEKKKN